MSFNGPGDRVSIPSRVIPKTPKMVLDAALLNTQYYKVRIKVKWSNSGNGVAPSPYTVTNCQVYLFYLLLVFFKFLFQGHVI